MTMKALSVLLFLMSNPSSAPFYDQPFDPARFAAKYGTQNDTAKGISQSYLGGNRNWKNYQYFQNKITDSVHYKNSNEKIWLYWQEPNSGQFYTISVLNYRDASKTLYSFYGFEEKSVFFEESEDIKFRHPPVNIDEIQFPYLLHFVYMHFLMDSDDRKESYAFLECDGNYLEARAYYNQVEAVFPNVRKLDYDRCENLSSES